MNRKNVNIPVFYLSIIFITVFISLIYNPRAAFIEEHPITAYEYPSIDMGTFFERANNPEYLKNDFYTNSISEPNPRWVFGYFVLTLSSIFGTDWYGILFFLKAFFSLSLPIILFALVYLKLQKEASINLPALSFATLVICWSAYSDDVFDIFSIAIWHPIYGYAIPQNIGIILSLTSCIFIFYGNSSNYISTGIILIMFLVSSLIHPASTLMATIFFILMHLDIVNFKKILLLILTFLIASISLLIFFYEPSSLDNKSFIEHYAFNRLPFHYTPSRFESSGLEWIENFIIINSIFATISFISILKKYKKLAYMSLIALFSYSMSILIQYVFVEQLMTVSIAIIGPSRFSMFGFWMLVLCLSYFIQLSRKKNSEYDNLKYSNLKRTALISTALIIISSIIFTILFKDRPNEWVIENNKPLYEWIENNISEDDVIAVPEMVMGINIQLFAKRAIFSNRPIGPVLFNGKSIKEDKERYEALFGNYNEQKKLEEKFPSLAIAALNYYHNLLPRKIKKVSNKYKLDYILFVNRMGDLKSFKYITPVYKSYKYTIYKISDL